MPQPKGRSGNPAGKPVGTKNKITSDVREALQKLFDGIADTLPDTLAKLEPAEKLNFIAKILPYLTPKMESGSAVTGDDEKTVIVNRTIISSEEYLLAQKKALESDKDDSGERYSEALRKFSDEDLNKIIELQKEYSDIWESYGGEPEQFPKDELDYSKFNYDELIELRSLKVREKEIHDKYNT